MNEEHTIKASVIIGLTPNELLVAGTLALAAHLRPGARGAPRVGVGHPVPAAHGRPHVQTRAVRTRARALARGHVRLLMVLLTLTLQPGARPLQAAWHALEKVTLLVAQTGENTAGQMQGAGLVVVGQTWPAAAR